MSKIRVLLVDDHAIVRAGLRMLLQAQPDVEIVGEAGKGTEAIQMVRELRPDVVLMDITMPDMDGFQATRKIKALEPETAVLALTIHEGEEYFFEMLNAGASGYVPKKAAPTELVSAIRVVHRGDVFLYPPLAKALVSDYLRRVESGKERESYDGLTKRQRQVVKLIARGCRNQEIADLLVISVKTVERHRENIYRKLNLHSRVELVKYAIQKGLIDLGE
ncbi:MAG: response regulator [Anaerolineae bacterium]